MTGPAFDFRLALSIVIPGERPQAARSGIHIHRLWLWIPGSPPLKSALADLSTLGADLG
jgi:hypothetical protein